MTSTSQDRRLGVNSGMAFKVPVIAATTGNITLSGEQTIDGVSTVTGDRVLVKDQTTGTQNGIYVVDTGSWTRDIDFDGSNDVVQGTLVLSAQGTVNAGVIFRLTTASPVIGTSSLAFSAAFNTATVSAFIQTLLDDTTAAEARTTLGAAASGLITGGGLTIGTGKIAGRTTAATGAIEALTLTQVLDLVGSAARGDILYRGALSWSRLAAGTSGYFLKTLGAGADPAWAAQAGVTLATPRASTSGTAIDFTSIPSGTKRIIVMGEGVSTNGTNTFLVQIGDSGGIETSGYDSGVDFPTSYGGTSTAGFRISYSNAAASSYYFRVELELMDSSTNTWVANGRLQITGSASSMNYSFGIKSTSAELDRVRITTTGGTDTFDAGKINIQYQ